MSSLPPMDELMRTLVVIATYNEIENLPCLVETILDLAHELDVLVSTTIRLTAPDIGFANTQSVNLGCTSLNVPANSD